MRRANVAKTPLTPQQLEELKNDSGTKTAAKIRALFDRGYSITEIKEILGLKNNLAYNTIYAYIKRTGVEVEGKREKTAASHSEPKAPAKATVLEFARKKISGEKIVMLTAYDYPTAAAVSVSGVDAVLVGDSLGMTVLGYDNTTRVEMEDMVRHTAAVARGIGRPLLVADMPFLSYHCGVPEAVKNAGRLIAQGGAAAVKLEGGRDILPEIKAILRAGIPVMGHIGLTPQSVNRFGGYRYQGKSEEDARRLTEDAKALEEAGVFSIVLECVPSALAKRITGELSIPTIGIGAGPDCDGQVLVLHDLVGLNPGHVPSFVKQYANVLEVIKNAVADYASDVKKGKFPGKENTVM